MTNYKARSGGMTLIETKILTGTSASVVFTLTGIDLKDDYSSLILYYAPKVTATLNVEMIVNGVTSAYYTYHIKASDQAITAYANIAHVNLANAVTTSQALTGKVEIVNSPQSAYISGSGFIGNGESATIQDLKFSCNTTVATATSSITITTSTSTFAIGSKFSLYGVKA